MREPLYYTVNPIVDHELNWTFERLHYASERQFKQWVHDVCRELVRIFDETGMPPKQGKAAAKIFKDFDDLVALDIDTQHGALDEHAGDRETLINSIKIPAADHFFPNIFQAQDNVGGKLLSVIGNLRDSASVVKLFTRTFKQDGYKAFADYEDGDKLEKYLERKPPSAGMWFFHTKESRHTRKKVRAKVSEVKALVKQGRLDKRALVDIDGLDDSAKVFVRQFNPAQKIFPTAFKFLQNGLVSAPTNFPAAVAKTIYTLYGTRVVKKKSLVIFDPSMGFGGRLLGALSLLENDITYIGCDPSPLNRREDGLSRYAALEGVFKTVVKKRTDGNFDSHYFICGSEVIHTATAFQQFKGKVDLVFTSPPYFNAEIYSGAASDSSIKFTTYEAWRERFLAQTLKTAAEWLAPNRYLVVNIARVTKGKYIYPLDEETIGICKALGLRHVTTKKMILRYTPGAGKISHGEMTTWHVAKVNGKSTKMEPVLVFKKTKPVPEHPKFVFSDLSTPPTARRRKSVQSA